MKIKKICKQARSYTNSFHKERNSLKTNALINLNKEKDNQKGLNFHKISMKSENKLINFSEMIPKLLDKIKTKNSSKHNIEIISNSFVNDSNSSEINDDKESENDINNKSSNNSPKKIPKLIIEKKEDINEYKDLEAPITYRQNRKIENSPTIRYRKYSKENKDSLVLKLHKYFFQDGEIDNIDTLIKYNINKIKINNNYINEDNSTKNIEEINGNNNNEFDYFNIKQQVINLMDKFADAFDKENKSQLISAIKDLNDFSEKHKFDYVSQLTLDWLIQMKEKKYDNCELKFIGYYNQIRDIMDKMLKELKKKADLIIIHEQKKMKEQIKENKIKKENNNNNFSTNPLKSKSNSTQVEVPSILLNKNIQKMNSINKEDIFRTKEIVPIKIDIEVQKTLNINEVEEILKNLDEGDLGNLGSKSNAIYNNNNKKLLNKHINNRNDNELEAFSYPFKENNICYIF